MATISIRVDEEDVDRLMTKGVKMYIEKFPHDRERMTLRFMFHNSVDTLLGESTPFRK